MDAFPEDKSEWLPIGVLSNLGCILADDCPNVHTFDCIGLGVLSNCGDIVFWHSMLSCWSVCSQCVAVWVPPGVDFWIVLRVAGNSLQVASFVGCVVAGVFLCMT
jgi:hypothetical protein